MSSACRGLIVLRGLIILSTGNGLAFYSVGGGGLVGAIYLVFFALMPRVFYRVMAGALNGYSKQQNSR